MNCSLCNEVIQHYQKPYNHLQINDSTEVDICESCIKKIMSWQQEQMAQLFPTKRMKQWKEKRKNQ